LRLVKRPKRGGGGIERGGTKTKRGESALFNW